MPEEYEIRGIMAGGHEIKGIKVIDGRLDNPRCPNFVKKRRPANSVYGVCLHQTAGAGLHPSMWPRIVNAHCAIQRNGTILLLQPFDHTIWALHDTPASKSTISVEIEGNFVGALDDPDTPAREDERSLWKQGGGPHDLTPEQILASDVLFGILRDWFRYNGVPWKRLIAHRQTAGDRRAGIPGWPSGGRLR